MCFLCKRLYQYELFFQSDLLQLLEAALVRTNYKFSEAKQL